MAKRQPTARAGKRLGRYVIEKELGRGGMGVVYLARDENLGRLVALKTTAVAGLGSAEKTRNQRRQRFIREVQALAQVSHENVVHVYDAGEEDDPDLGWLLFYSMQYVEGITLAQLVQRQGALDPGAAAAVCSQVAYGLGAGHQRGIVHRDVKPANIFLSYGGRALIGDFGIAKIEGSTQITRRDQLVGTPNYLAPEQILGDGVTAATDVFALGALFYVIVTNRPLRTKLDAAALLATAKGNAAKEKILAEESIPLGLRRVVARALEREPKRRWADGTAFGDALSELATRIPPLGEDITQDTQRPKPSSSLDDQGAFATRTEEQARTTSSAPPKGSSPLSAVEAAAQALLNEVGKAKPAKRDESAPEPLPVARSESTVMFNLRAMEDREGERPRGKGDDGEGDGPLLEPIGDEAPLPVARTESTVLFNLRKMERRGPERSGDVTDPDASDADTLAPLADDELAHEDDFEQDLTAPVEMELSDAESPPEAEKAQEAKSAKKAKKAKAASQLEPVSQPAVREVVPEAPPRPPPPLDERRVRRLGATSAGGALLGFVVLLTVRFAFGAGPPVLPKPVQEAAAQRAQPTLREVPEHCGVAARDAARKARAQAFVDEALRLKAQGKDADARKALERATEADGANVQAHYELAQLLARVDGDSGAAAKEYECVVVLDADSELGQRAARAIGSAGRASP